ncbi:MAG: hypothetical protein JSU72_17165 [Deltaproteobacteria bacterium]|nr:MAG: hypothetical protein JSU72_17165 [Deltaproteobacteria bacterium]
MRVIKHVVILLGALAFSASVSCSGGGVGGLDGGGVGDLASGGIGGSGIAVGTVTAFGSIFVDGVKYKITGDTTITIDGEPGKEERDLAVGQVVTVKWKTDTDGNLLAESVEFDDNLEGPVSIEPDTGELIVLGQKVLVDELTQFAVGPLATGKFENQTDVSEGNILEVSGFEDADGRISATFIRKKADNSDDFLSGDEDKQFEVQGTVDEAPDGGIFTINNNSLRVDASGLDISDFEKGVLVQVKGVEVKSDDFDGTTLSATAIEIEEEDLGGVAGEKVELEGIVTRIDKSNQILVEFFVDRQRVRTDVNTKVFENGTPASISRIKENVKLEVEGELDKSGLVSAHKVFIRKPSQVKIEAIAQQVNLNDSTVTLLGIPVTVNDLTQLDDDRDDDGADAERRFGLERIELGDYLQVRGFEDEDPTGEVSVIATKLERDDPPEDPDEAVSLRGAIKSVEDDSFVILGVTIQTNAATDFERFASLDDLSVGSLVEVKGSLISEKTLLAVEVKLKIKND